MDLLGARGALAAVIGSAFVTAVWLSVWFVNALEWTDRGIAQNAGGLLLGGHLDVYALAPEAQMGPLSLAVAGALPTSVYIGLVCLLLPVFLVAAYDAAGVAPRLTHIPAAILLGVVWHRFAITAHLDDVLVLIGVTLVIGARRRGLPWLAAAGFLLAVSGKPTAVLFLPLVFLVSKRAAVFAAVGTLVVWGPFFLADPSGLLSAGRGVVGVFPGSLPDLLGSEVWGTSPWWVRPLQLLGGMALCYFVARRRSFAAAVLAVVAFRGLLEPGTYPLYWQSAIAAAFIFDLGRRGWWTVGIAFAGWIVTLSSILSPVEAGLRLALFAVLLGIAVASGDRVERRRSLPGLELSSEPVRR